MKQQPTSPKMTAALPAALAYGAPRTSGLGALGYLVLASALGCASQDPEQGLTGIADLHIVAADGVGSVGIIFEGASRTTTTCVAVDGEKTTRLDHLPTGSVTVNAAAYADAQCGGDATWFAEPQVAELERGKPVPIRITFRPNGIASVEADFDDDEACGAGSVASWSDEFAASTFDPAWTVWQYGGVRHNNQTSPANHVSLTDKAGVLRYYVDPMTHVAEWHDYMEYFDSPYYWYDPGLSAERDLGGTHWSLDVKAEYFLPNVINAAYHELAVHFDPSGTAGLHCYFDRFSNDDVGAGTSTTHNVFFAGCKTADGGVGEEWSEWAGLETNIVRFVRFVRDGASFKIRVSADETSWNDVVDVTLPEAFSCVGQKVLISGAGWFSPAGSYADYDYVRFTRQN